jgi:hypothetical protein
LIRHYYCHCLIAPLLHWCRCRCHWLSPASCFRFAIIIDAAILLIVIDIIHWLFHYWLSLRHLLIRYYYY